MTEANSPITEDWLREVGFKWSQIDRQPAKHWILWLGRATGSFNSGEDLGVELATVSCRSNEDPVEWFCWLRSDLSHRYHRFIHIRHVRETREVIELVEALTGQAWDPANHIYGMVHKPENAERIRQESQRLDRVILRECPKWAKIEKDDTMAGALPEHLEAHENAKQKG